MNVEVKSKQIVSDKSLKIVKGDITEETVDAIVNAANSHLRHGGGVAGAIVRKGGYIIQEESNRIGFVPAGDAAITGAGNLSAKFVIHAVGPRWGEGDEDKKLQNAVVNSLKLAEKKELVSVSLPAISSGIFGFPKNRCARIILKNITEYLSGHPAGTLKEVRVCLFDREMVDVFLAEFDQ